MKLPSRPDRAVRLVAVTAIFAVGAAACVRPEDPKVAIDKIEASLVFGVKPKAEPVQAPVQEVANQIVAEAFAAAPEAPAPILPRTFDLPPAQAPVFSTLPSATPRPSDCPAAPPTAAAELPVEVNISGVPPVGMYRWKREGKITAADGTETPIGRSFERRFIRKYTKVSETVFTFESVAPVAGSDRVAVTTFRVNTAPQATNVDPGYNQIVTVPTVGEPERGVTLDKIEYQDRNGVVQDSFTPTTGLLLLPLPVVSGESYRSVAVDPKSGQTIIHEANVLRRARIDACGKLADGWLVDATQTSTESVGSPPVQLNYSYIVGTQYGGILLNEHVQASDGADGTVDLDYTQAQLEPDPLPTGA